MIKMQPYVKMWYDYFEQGKVMGLKCKRCGSYEFPPVTVCNNCKGTDLEWVEMSGEGKLQSFTAVPYPDAPFAEYAGYYYGRIIMKEGPDFATMILNIDPEHEVELFEKLPVDVKAEIMQRDGYKYVVFRVME